MGPASYTGATRAETSVPSPLTAGRRRGARSLGRREGFDAGLGDAMGNQGQWPLRELFADGDGAFQRLEAGLDAGGVAREHRGDRLPGKHLVPRLDGDHESDTRLDGVFDLRAAAAHGDDRPADGARLDRGDDAGSARREDLDRLRL